MRQERKQTQLDDISAAATESVSADLRVLVPGGRQGGDQQFEGSDHAVAAGFDDQVYNLVANALVANAIMLQNVADMTEVLHQLAEEGFPITANDN